MKVSCRSVEILLRYSSLCQFCQFYPIHNFSNLFPPKQLIFFAKSQNFPFWWGRYISQFSQILQLFESFPTEVAQKDSQWQILPPKWLRLAQNDQFSTFPIFLHKKQLRLTLNGQFHPICTFSNLFPPKQLIFSPNLKIFVLGGGGTSANFPRFCNFHIISNRSGSK